MTLGNDKTRRRLHSWIEGFREYTLTRLTPDLYRTWGAIWTIGSAMERRVWTWTKIEEPTFNNLFVMLLCEPGGGKSQILSPVKDIIERVDMHVLSPSGITREALLDFMQENSKRQIVGPNVADMCASVLCIAPEFGNFIREHNLNQMSTLNELWDCPTSFKDYTRTSNSVDLSYPFLSFITGAQPAFLAASLPDAAYGMGFMARTILVYSDEVIREDLFEESDLEASMRMGATNPLRNDLVNDLRIITGLTGQVKWEIDARKAINAWIHSGCAPAPEHAKLQHYNKRRVNMLIRIATIMSVATSNELVVSMKHIDQAKDLMIATEKRMVQAFSAISSKGYDIALEETFDYIWDDWLDGGRKYISEQRLVHALKSKLPLNQIQYAIKTMLQGGMIIKIPESPDMEGKRKFKPVPRAKHGSG